ncbi:DUF3253 domain-containing protein [Allobranchiibius sp. GilTou38]|uniref:DUF3253 domain-containing protein n=1 Tax=Allobranchiibius sp. GilTou38 TaxID=2815210 RepID=UPI0032601844
MSTPADRTCVSCGRRIEWRRKWERDWEQVRYCSAACRRRGVTQTDTLLEKAILRLLASGSRTATIAPSDAAEAVSARGDVDEDLAEPARRAARRLVESGQVVIVQGSRVVDPSTAKGPFRIRRA